MSLFSGFSAGRDPAIDRRKSLKGVPVLNSGIKVVKDGARLKITAYTPRSSGFMGRFQPPVMKRNIKLDEIGSYVFGLIDGDRDTREIINRFIERYDTNRREAELSVIAFLKSLTQRGVISIAIRGRVG